MNNNLIKIIIAGDFCPKNKIANELSKINENSIFSNELKQVFIQSDLSIVNLECPVTNETKGIVKEGTLLKADTNAINLLNELNINLVTLANNHIRDYGNKGVEDTINICKNNNIDTIGAGKTKVEAREIKYKKLKNKILAIINVAENEFAYATDSRFGANSFDIINLLQDIQIAKKYSDYVLLIMHGGLEYYDIPSPKSIKLLRFLAEQGLIAIIRHHPHCVQGYEIWKGTPIFYSIGNFLFDSDRKKPISWYNGILIEITIQKDNSVYFDVLPYEQCKNGIKVSLLTGKNKEEYINNLNKLSHIINDNNKFNKEWLKIIENEKYSYYGQLLLFSRLVYRILRKLNLLFVVRPNISRRLKIENIIRCEARQELFIDILVNDNIT